MIIDDDFYCCLMSLFGVVIGCGWMFVWGQRTLVEGVHKRDACAGDEKVRNS
jgi:hypothetical protein